MKLLGILLCYLVAFCGSAEAATTIIEPMGSHFPYQKWINESPMPSPSVVLEVIEQPSGEGCPSREFEYAGCTAPWYKKIWLAAEQLIGNGPRSTFMHEMGHNFDYFVMPEWARERFMALYRLEGAWSILQEPQLMTPSEYFAEVYAECTVEPYLTRREMNALGFGPIDGSEVISGNRRAHNKSCRMIRNLGKET